jgi:hypothetical protein
LEAYYRTERGVLEELKVALWIEYKLHIEKQKEMKRAKSQKTCAPLEGISSGKRHDKMRVVERPRATV